MFDSLEHKLVQDTLAKRCAWLSKSLADSRLDEKLQAEYKVSLKVLTAALRKLERQAPPAKTPAAPPPKVKPKKAQSRLIPLAEAHILIAEDDQDSALLLQGIVEDIGIKHIVTAKDGREAVNTLKNTSPPFDIVLCDWDMPELTGLEVRRQVRQLARLQDTHFIMVTAVSEVSRIREAIAEGITDYVVKPVDASIIEKKIKTALGHCDDPGVSADSSESTE
jgi:two-component system, chemotaxis family, chemotaxis protein CheY